LHKEVLEHPMEGFNTATIDHRETGQRIEIIYRRPKHGNKPTFFYCRDITIRTRVEEQLRERNAFLDGLIESSVDGIIAANMNGDIILFNPGAQEMLGYTEEEALASLHTTKLYKEGMAQEIMRKMLSDDYGGKGKCLKHRVVGLRKNGEDIPFSLSGGIIYDSGGNPIASFGIFTDLREREEMEKRLREKQLELIQSEKMASLGKLSAGVAHEINNPLSGVLIYANLVLEELPEGSPLRDDIERIISETTRCKGIVRELLDFARQEEIGYEASDINRIIEEGIHLIRNQAIFHNVDILLDLDPNLPPIYASPARMNQVMLNLTLNAAEAMDGKGTLTITTRPIQNGNKVRVTVCDTGCGIPPEIKSKVFDPFFTTKEVGKGTGLGLSVTYRILNDCGATIEVESEPGKGATFVIDFLTVTEWSEQIHMETS